MSALKTLIALTLVVSPATLGIATYTGALENPFAIDAAAEAFGGETLQEYEQEYDTTIATGELDLRIDDGMVRVIGWEENKVHVIVLQEEGEDNTFSDRETQVDIQDNTQGDHLNISVTVDRTGTYAAGASADGLQVGERGPERAIVVFAPAAADYARIFACSGQAHVLSETVRDAFHEIWPDDSRSQEDRQTCLPIEESPTLGGTISINADGTSAKGLNLTSGLEGVSGKDLAIHMDYSDVWITAATFETAYIATDHGDLAAEGFEATEVHLLSDYGKVTLDGAADELTLVADHGDVDLVGSFAQANMVAKYGDVTVEGTLDEGTITVDHGDFVATLSPRSSGALDVLAQYGNIEVHVPTGGALGYLVDARTDYGDVEVSLEDADVEREDGDEHDNEESVTAKTRGYENRAVQVEMSLTAEHGDILVTDGTESLDDGEEDEDEETASGENGPGDLAGLATSHAVVR